MNIEIIENRRLWEVDHRIEATTSGMTIFMNGKSEDFDLSHLAEDGEYLLEDCMVLEYNPITSIKKKGDRLTVTVFYNNPYEYVENWTPPFERNSKSFKIIPTVDNNVEMAREAQKKILHDECEIEMESRNKGIESTAIGAKIDCRNIDVLRVDNLIKMLESMGATDSTPVDYILYDNKVKQVTLLQVKQAQVELIQNITNMLYHKHALYAQVDAASTVAEVKAVLWQW